MQLLTDTRYGTRLMLELAHHDVSAKVRMRDMAADLGISQNYLEKIAHKLRRAGFIKASRGPKGGYMLGRSANEISIGDLVRTLEESACLVRCATDNPDCPGASSCLMRTVWMEGQQAMFEHFDAITLDELVRRNQSRQCEKSQHPEHPKRPHYEC